MINIEFACGGCDRKETITNAICKTFTSITGKSHGFGSYTTTKIEDICPDGWIAFDPYTQCTYCPDCWKEIADHVEVAK